MKFPPEDKYRLLIECVCGVCMCILGDDKVFIKMKKVEKGIMLKETNSFMKGISIYFYKGQVKVRIY